MSLRRVFTLLIAMVLAWHSLISTTLASSIKDDESLILFPTSGYLNEAEDRWIVPVHGWIFEPEQDSLWRGLLVDRLLEALELSQGAVDNALFRDRARAFLVDNERGKEIVVRIGESDYALPRSAANGHFEEAVRVRRNDIDSAAGDLWLPIQVVMPAGDRRHFAGQVQLLAPRGLSVISDIDDTIKVSNVADKQALLANTFLREFRAVPGMAKLYRQWAEQGVAFHYVSASPWQLYEPLWSFLANQGFPKGSAHLRSFRIKDESFFDLFAAPEAYKLPTIEAVLSAYPKRHFILVGDSTEKDPEIYGALARRHPGQIRHVFVRDVPPYGDRGERYVRAFEGIPGDRWTLFRNANELESLELYAPE